VGDDRMEFLSANHSTVGGNQELAERVFGQVDRLHGLVNNVGGFHNDRSLTDDGYEATLAITSSGR
jgi:NAD(P)-dependent dehydrogenase (short-subunit alcohol dehydrogenase family)